MLPNAHISGAASRLRLHTKPCSRPPLLVIVRRVPKETLNRARQTCPAGQVQRLVRPNGQKQDGCVTYTNSSFTHDARASGNCPS